MTNETFFDRKPYLDLLQKRAGGLLEGYRQNIAVVGDELVGKTSIALHFLKRFCDGRVTAVYIDVKPESVASFTRRFIGVLLYNFLAGSGISLREDLDYLVEKTQKYAPRTATRAQALIAAADGKKRAGIFAELLSLTDVLHQETGKFSLVLFDEFHNLEEVGFKDLYKEWSRTLLTQKHVMYVILSSMKYKTRAILAKNLSLLFGNFEVVEVEPFSARTSEEYLAQRLQGAHLTAALRHFLVHFAGGYPFYLEILGRELCKRGSANIGAVLETLMFDSSGILHQRFSNYLKRFLDLKHSADYLGILRLVSQGRNRIRDIGHVLHKSKEDVTGLVNYLLEMDAVGRSGDFLKINDHVFSFWLKYVHQGMLHSLSFDAREQKRKFRDAVETMVAEYSACMQKPIAERLMEVLRLFEDEIVQIERKRVRLSRFREVKHLEFDNRCVRSGLIGRSADSLWVLGLKPGQLTEDDVSAFAGECKKFNTAKQQQKIIVTLQDIDDNTRLRALEEKIWTWDVNQLNHVFDLYSKPCVIG